MQAFLTGVNIPDDSSVERMGVADVQIQMPRIKITFGWADLVKAPVVKRRTGVAAKRPRAANDDSPGESDATGGDGPAHGPDTEGSSVLSESGTDAEEAIAEIAHVEKLLPPVEDGGDDEADDEGDDAIIAKTRQKPGSNTVQEYTNSYFTCTSDPYFIDVVMTIKPVWRKTGEMRKQPQAWA